MKSSHFLIPALFVMIACTNTTSEKFIATEAQLGEALYFDPILSRDSSVSCASCHKPEFAFADNKPVSVGIYHTKGTRNTPTSMNQSTRNAYFWDGRAETLEDQALGPIENPAEMDLPVSVAIRRLLRSEKYKNAFVTVYGKLPDNELLSQALSGFEKTLETNNTAFDKYMNESDTTLFTESAKRGLSLFNGKAKCFDCHFGVDFSGNDEFKNIGLYNGKELNDKGRFLISGKAKDLGAFKTPGLRNIAQTAPYMHNGMFKTLREVIDHYDTPDKFVKGAINRDTTTNRPLHLTEKEKTDLEKKLDDNAKELKLYESEELRVEARLKDVKATENNEEQQKLLKESMSITNNVEKNKQQRISVENKLKENEKERLQLIEDSKTNGSNITAINDEVAKMTKAVYVVKEKLKIYQ